MFIPYLSDDEIVVYGYDLIARYLLPFDGLYKPYEFGDIDFNVYEGSV